MKVTGVLEGERVVVWDKECAEKLFNLGYYGKLRDNRLELSLFEAFYLVEKNLLEVRLENRALTKSEFLQLCKKLDHRFYFRYIVYKDLKDKGYPVKTGLKFGCDFRVYEKGVHPLKRGKKSEREHTRWVIFCVPEGFTFSFQELARAVRLAHNIRAEMLWAVVTKDKKVRYFRVEFYKP